MINYSPFDRSRRVLTLLVVFDFDRTYICRKNSKNMEDKKMSAFKELSRKLRLLIDSGGIFAKKKLIIPSLSDTLIFTYLIFIKAFTVPY